MLLALNDNSASLPRKGTHQKAAFKKRQSSAGKYVSVKQMDTIIALSILRDRENLNTRLK